MPKVLIYKVRLICWSAGGKTRGAIKQRLSEKTREVGGGMWLRRNTWTPICFIFGSYWYESISRERIKNLLLRPKMKTRGPAAAFGENTRSRRGREIKAVISSTLICLINCFPPVAKKYLF